MNKVIFKLVPNNAVATTTSHPTIVEDVEKSSKSHDKETILFVTKVSKPQTIAEDVDKVSESHDDETAPSTTKISKWAVVKAANSHIVPRTSRGDIKLNSIIDELQQFAIEENQDAQTNDEILAPGPCKSVRLIRQRLSFFLHRPQFHYAIILLVLIDLLVVLVDLVLAQLSAPCLSETEMEEYHTTEQRVTCLLDHSSHLSRVESFLFYFSVLLLSVFVLETFTSSFAFGRKYFQSPMYVLDGVIVLTSFIMEIYLHYGHIGRAGRAASAIIILRLWKIIRAIHAVAHSITIKNGLLIKKIREAKLLLEEEKQQTELTLQKQEIRVEYFTNILTKLKKLPSTRQIEHHVEAAWKQRRTIS